MTTVTRVQVSVVVRYFCLFLVAITALGALTSYVGSGDIVVSWPIFLINLIVSGVLAWQFYKYRAHVVLSYDNQRFCLDVGRQRMSDEWSQFSHVSLVHTGGGDFVLRLYKGDQANLELPVSALRLNPQEFRFVIMDFVRGKAASAQDPDGASAHMA